MIEQRGQQAPPASATALPTALVGLAVLIAMLVLSRGVAWPAHLKVLAVTCATAAAMAAVDLGWFRTSWRASSGLDPQPRNRVSPGRIARKLIGFWATIAVLYGVYSLLPEYGGTFYDPAWATARFVAPWLVVIAPFYILYVDRRQADPEDGYAQLGALLTGQTQVDWPGLAHHGRVWLVKGFFLPLMFVYLTDDIDAFSRTDFVQVVSNFGALYDFLYTSLYIPDLLFAIIGYCLTLRLLDSHVRSVEPTVTGWVVCLVCYQPFWSLFSRQYLTYEQDNFYWGNLTSGHAVLYVLWGSAIIACLVVYTFSTVVFGLRFSNLTHRGIITSGPYRFTKHPAYISKCLSFWLVSVPFISDRGWQTAIAQTLLLLIANSIYVARALTEERHLARDPIYREYQAYIREHGLFARLRKSLVAVQGMLSRAS